MIRRLFTLPIRLYQLIISPWLGPSCRYTPSCSSYCITCIEQFGVFKGLLLGAKRIGRCHPFGGSGYDPPPALSHNHNRKP